jgi:hypothetical protein
VLAALPAPTFYSILKKQPMYITGKPYILLAAFALSASTCRPKKPLPKLKPDIAAILKSDISKFMMADSFAFLLPALDSIFIDDQRYRSIYDNELYLNNLNEQTRLDSINAIKIKAIVARYGWLGASQIGATRSTYLALALQHFGTADREYFLHILLDSYRKKTFTSTGMMGFIDRYLTNKHEQQLFGIDFCLINGLTVDGADDIYPIYQPTAIEERWKKYSGFTTYTKFIKGTYKFTWNAEEHLKYVPANAKTLKINLDSTTHITRLLHLLDSCRALMDKK